MTLLLPTNRVTRDGALASRELIEVIQRLDRAILFNTVLLQEDVANTAADTLADITGLSFKVAAGVRYRFEMFLDYTAAATTTGARFSVNGPSATRLSYSSRYALTTTSQTVNEGLTAYNLPAAANATSAATAGNQAVVSGWVTPSADGTVIGRFAAEVAASAVTVKAGSFLRWARV